MGRESTTSAQATAGLEEHSSQLAEPELRVPAVILVTFCSLGPLSLSGEPQPSLLVQVPTILPGFWAAILAPLCTLGSRSPNC